MRRAIILAVLLCATDGQAFSINQTFAGYTTRWPAVAIPVPYLVNPAGSADISNGSDLQAIHQSFADWQAVSCASVTFLKAGTLNVATTPAAGGEPDGKNLLVWIETSAWELGSQVLGVTTPLYQADGSLYEADIAFNGYHHKWTTTGQWNRADVKSVAIHEIGHLLGLQHNLGGFPANDPPTMAPTVDPYGKTATLNSDDRKGLCYLYPAGGQYTCQTDADCPFVVDTDQVTGKEIYSAKMICQGQSCIFDPSAQSGLGILGDECASSSGCKAPFFCQALSSGGSYCSLYCDPIAQDCPSGFLCAGYADGDGGACIPDPGGNTPEGETCWAHTACASGLCFPSFDGYWQCRTPCDVPGASCGAGRTCYESPGYTPGCLPDELIPATGVQNGDPCNADEDCQAGICLVNPGTGGPRFCRAACDPAMDACAPGFWCVPPGACVPGAAPTTEPGPPGSPCASASDCVSGLCQGGLCRTPCVLFGEPCPVAGDACLRLAPGKTLGACQPTGDAARGAACTADVECSTLVCASADGGGPTCQVPCDPGSGAGCAAAEACTADPGAPGTGTCMPGTPAIGGGTGTEATGRTPDVPGGGTPSGATGDPAFTGGGGGPLDDPSRGPSAVSPIPSPSAGDAVGCAQAPRRGAAPGTLLPLLLLIGLALRVRVRGRRPC